MDKHFNDNWVIPYYNGFTIDLYQQWLPYKAANKALENTLEHGNIKELTDNNLEKLSKGTIHIKEYLREGYLTEDLVLDKLQDIMNTIREANVTVRWFLLQRTTVHKKLNEQINEKLQPEKVISLLLLLSQFEEKLSKIISNLHENKQDYWDKDKSSSCEMMEEISEYFAGNRGFSKSKDENYANWFKQMKEEIGALNFTNSTSAGKKIQHLISVLEDVEKYHQVSSNLQIKQFLMETRDKLKHMIKIVNIRQQVIQHLALIGDISYCWECVKDYSKYMQDKIKVFLFE